MSGLRNSPNVYHGYRWLPQYATWLKREVVPAQWQHRYNDAFRAADASLDDEPGHRARVAWLDVCDDLHDRLRINLLDEPAVRANLAADDLRKRGEWAAIDAFLNRRTVLR